MATQLALVTICPPRKWLRNLAILKISVTLYALHASFTDSQVKDFLSQVPNLYVEDAAVCSGRCAELRIRSVTNDAVTAMALKNLFVMSIFLSSR